MGLSSVPRRVWERQRSTILAAVPQGGTRPATQRAWLTAVAGANLGSLRADARTNLLAVARVLAGHADWQAMTTRPTWAVLSARTGLSRRTVARALARLREARLLGVVATGRSAGAAAAVFDVGADAAVYVLAVRSTLRSVTTTTGTPPPALTFVERPPRARRVIHRPGRASSAPPRWPSGRRPASKNEMRAAAETARWVNPVLRRISTAYVVALLRDWWSQEVDWTLGDVLTALEARPDGSRWFHTGEVRHVPGFVRHRLAAWRNADGELHLSPSQQSRAMRTELDAAKVARDARAEASRAATAPVHRADVGLREAREQARAGWARAQEGWYRR